MENTAIGPTSPGTMSPTPFSPESMSAALLTYKQKLAERIPAIVSTDYRNTLLDTIEAQVDVPSLDCKLRWTVEAAYHNNTEPASHEVVALCLCFDSGALEDDSLRVQRGFYAKHSGLAHHMRDWSLRGLIDKHNAKVHAGDISAPLITHGDGDAADSVAGDGVAGRTDRALAAARREKRPASAVEDLSPGPPARRPHPPVDPSTIYYESRNTPRLNSLVKNRGTKSKRTVAPGRPVIPQAVLDRLPPSFMDPSTGGFAQLSQLGNPDTGMTRNMLPPSNRVDSSANSGSVFSNPGGIAAAAAGDNTSDTPGNNAENPWVVAETATEARLASLAAQIAMHRQRARDKLQHARALREEHGKMAERQPLEGGAGIKDFVVYINESHSLAGRSIKHQEEAVAAVAEAGRLESELVEEALKSVNQRMDRVQGIVVGTASILKREKAACASFAAQQVAQMTALKSHKEK
ncbi:hypothetical protein ColTof4_13519 [Colletotrichum tofieldiae]|uniref:Uncharacterized protein n=1 Tax=Colletotrichum tofieldiae TaxID=708197 RepID=A0A166N084_9PEZI|nr:hypothetical protein CT0861_02802 [Colletotrichum tofieldiae]GKT53069.1 hypothetical protein ColTof3_00408 [Colletotrichum tofieldiae]GKT81096.1 hypothetical protein ColTof4_13519 [Colletotrichum tofieldiae]GKT88655.1 hypothetical protein Ct61P_06505 [Colletotrichum tofieldiae]